MEIGNEDGEMTERYDYRRKYRELAPKKGSISTKVSRIKGMLIGNIWDVKRRL
jgi:hypothetical protein